MMEGVATVAGVDAAYGADDSVGVTKLVVLRYPDLTLLHTDEIWMADLPAYVHNPTLSPSSSSSPPTHTLTVSMSEVKGPGRMREERPCDGKLLQRIETDCSDRRSAH